MNKLFEINLNTEEQARRLVIGAMIIGVVLFNPAIPAWLALVGCYPIFTAILQFDPLNSVFKCVIEKVRKSSGLFVHGNLSVKN